MNRDCAMRLCNAVVESDTMINIGLMIYIGLFVCCIVYLILDILNVPVRVRYYFREWRCRARHNKIYMIR